MADDPATDTGAPRALRALVLGGVAWNTMVYVDEFPSPHPQTVFASDTHEAIGSSGAGKALNLSRLGFDTTLWALVGDDDPGTRIRMGLEENEVVFLSQLDPLGTTRHVNLMDAAGERISIFANAGSTRFTVDTDLVADAFGSADLVSVTILDHCRAFLPLAAEARRPVWCDIHDYDGVNPYHHEFIEAAGYLFLSSVNLPNYRRFMEERVHAGAQVVVCTHGSNGASGLDASGTWVDVEAAPVDRPVDTNGAGDAFFAGFAHSWLRGDGLDAAMESGALMAAAAVESLELAPEVSAVPARFGR